MGRRNYMENEVCLKTEMQMYAQVSKVLGNRWVEALCLDGKTRRCRIRGSNTCGWVELDSLVLISLREYQPAKSDVILVYEPSEVEQLKLLNEIPDYFPFSVPERLQLTLMDIKVKDRRTEFFRAEEDNLKVNHDMVWNGSEWEENKQCVCEYCIHSSEKEEEEEEGDDNCSSEEDDDCSSEEDESENEEDESEDEEDESEDEEDESENEEDSDEEYSEEEYE